MDIAFTVNAYGVSMTTHSFVAAGCIWRGTR